jgi:hypothetical protein
MVLELIILKLIFKILYDLLCQECDYKSLENIKYKIMNRINRSFFFIYIFDMSTYINLLYFTILINLRKTDFYINKIINL